MRAFALAIACDIHPIDGLRVLNHPKARLGHFQNEVDARFRHRREVGLGPLDDLPPDDRQGLSARNLVPLWPALRAALPYAVASRRTRRIPRRHADVHPQLLEAEAGIDENEQATPSIYIGMPLVLPGETAPNHRHSPSAVRFVVEGDGGFTIVEGEKCPMEPGDLILTPSGPWHEHGHSDRARWRGGTHAICR